MIEYDLKKNNNKKNEKAYGKYYAKPHISETVDLDELADHMHGHNSPFSAGTIKGHPHRCRDPHQGAPAHGQECKARQPRHLLHQYQEQDGCRERRRLHRI